MLLKSVVMSIVPFVAVGMLTGLLQWKLRCWVLRAPTGSLWCRFKNAFSKIHYQQDEISISIV